MSLLDLFDVGVEHLQGVAVGDGKSFHRPSLGVLGLVGIDGVLCHLEIGGVFLEGIVISRRRRYKHGLAGTCAERKD
jgi:hypothetical protein